jgi:hypothetical protein
MATGWIITTTPRMRETQIAHVLWRQINKLTQAGGTGTPRPYRSFERRLLGGASSVGGPASFIIAAVCIARRKKRQYATRLWAMREG